MDEVKLIVMNSDRGFTEEEVSLFLKAQGCVSVSPEMREVRLHSNIVLKMAIIYPQFQKFNEDDSILSLHYEGYSNLKLEFSVYWGSETVCDFNRRVVKIAKSVEL